MNENIKKIKDNLRKVFEDALTELDSLENKEGKFMPVPEGIKIWGKGSFGLIINKGRTLFHIYNGLICLENYPKGETWTNDNDSVQLMKVNFNDIKTGDLILVGDNKEDYDDKSNYFLIDENNNAYYVGITGSIINLCINNYIEFWKVVRKE